MQHGVDVILRLLDPDGAVLIESDSVNGSEGPESVSLISDRAGTHVLEVIAAEARLASTSVNRRRWIDIRAAEQGEATPRNRRRAAADQRAAAGRQVFFAGGAGAHERALAELDAAADEFRSLEDAAGEADSRYMVAVIENDRGRFGAMLAPLDRALDLARSLGDSRREAETLWMRGWAHWGLVDWRLAVDDLTRALPLFRALGDTPREARTLCRLAAPYFEMGHFSRAQRYANAAVRAARSVGEAGLLSEALNTQATVHLFAGDAPSAVPLLEEALGLDRRRGLEEAGVGNLVSLGVSLRLLGRHDDARARLGEALEIVRKQANRYSESTILAQLARTYVSPSEIDAHRSLYERTLEVSRASGYERGATVALTGLARASLASGDLAHARDLVEQAVAVHERQWRRVPHTELKATYLEDQFPAYELHVDILAATDRADSDAGAAALAFSAADGARARALRQQLARDRVEADSDVPRRLLDRRREIARSLIEETSVTGGASNGARLEALDTELLEVERKITNASPRWAGLMLPDPVSVDEVQSRLLDADTVLLEYALGNDRSWVFAIGVAKLSLHELPARAAINQAAREVADTIAARNRRVRFETEPERRERITNSDAAFARAACTLSRLVLVPVAGEIAGKRIALVADGALHYVPFGALPDPRVIGGDASAPTCSADVPLALDHELVHLPSASTLREIRRHSASRTEPTAKLAVVADPVLERDDPRLRSGSGLRSMLASMVVGEETAAERATADDPVESQSWPELPYARLEGESILALAPGAETMGAFGLDANHAIVESPALAGSRYVHFATHAWLEDGRPELSGIVLSQFDARGRPQNGLLSVADVYDLRLAADLVVLSGCRTALGREVRGEGLIGLSRGFMFAGAPRVIVSLWDVQDQATAELMKRFYSNLLGGGMRPAAALRAAQIDLSRSDAWRAPYHWAGFVLQGDWR